MQESWLSVKKFKWNSRRNDPAAKAKRIDSEQKAT